MQAITVFGETQYTDKDEQATLERAMDYTEPMISPPQEKLMTNEEMPSAEEGSKECVGSNAHVARVSSVERNGTLALHESTLPSAQATDRHIHDPVLPRGPDEHLTTSPGGHSILGAVHVKSTFIQGTNDLDSVKEKARKATLHKKRASAGTTDKDAGGKRRIIHNANKSNCDLSVVIGTVQTR